jgi:hypothetical protein
MTVGTQWDTVVLAIMALGRGFLPFLLVYNVHCIRQGVGFAAHYTRPMLAGALINYYQSFYTLIERHPFLLAWRINVVTLYRGLSLPGKRTNV